MNAVPHPDYPKYLIHSDGRVFSLYTKRFLRPVPRSTYLSVWMCKDGNKVQRKVHLLVLETFHGPRPVGMEARHLNGDRTDNRAENLAWGTKAENEADRIRHGANLAGERNGRAKLTWEQVREIRAASGSTSQRALAQRYGVSTYAIRRVIRQQGWRAETTPTPTKEVSE